MRPDFDQYATGYAWLDKLTLPFWTLYSKWHEWRFYRFLGKGDADKGQEILRQAVAVDRGKRFTCINGHDTRVHGVRISGIVDGTPPVYECGFEGCHAHAELLLPGLIDFREQA